MKSATRGLNVVGSKINYLQEALTVAEKERRFLELSKYFIAPNDIKEKELKDAYCRGKLIEEIGENILSIKQSSQLNLESIFEDFFQNNIKEILESKPKVSIYTISDCPLFAKFNAVTRTISTLLGHVWEVIANSSPQVLSTESEFNVKIKGVDTVSFIDGNSYFTQIKTTERTLTGSQVTRSRNELQVHEKSLFVAAINTGNGWTFNSQTTKRLKGSEYWSKIGIDYDEILYNCKCCLQRFEKEIIRQQN